MKTEDDDGPVRLGVVPGEGRIEGGKGASDPNGEEGEKPAQMVRIIDDEKNGMITTPVTDPYQYTVRDGATSCELFKIEIHNIPRYTSYATLKKLFTNKFSLKPQKIKLIGNPVKFAFVAFANEQDRTAALKSLDGFVWKGTQIQASVAAPKSDPLAVKRMADVSEDHESDKKLKRADDPSHDVTENMSIADRLNDQVAALWRLPYPDQLIEKTKIVYQFLVELHRDIGRMIDHSQSEPSIGGGQESKERLFKWHKWCKKTYDRKSCIPAPIEASPVVDGYRNKCEFSIDMDRTVGFRLGCYKKGSLRVAPVTKCPIVSPAMKKIVSVVESFMKDISKLQPFDPVTHSGHWKQVMVRSNSSADNFIVVLTMEPKDLTEVEVADEERSLGRLMSEEVPSASLYIELMGKKNRDQRLRLIRGSRTLTENLTISGKTLSFQISPDAFFQINSPAAEICYQKIAEQLHLTKETLLLDVCCGTGTIGISLASAVSQVVGIELNADAVKDAEKNAADNNVTNIKFLAGKAEELVSKIVSSSESHAKFNEIVAVIDPPRAGLNQIVIKALRSAEKLSRIIYVSCEPRFAKQNLIDLCRPVSKTYKGNPFIPTSVIPIDMFPHTNRCEVIFAYERLEDSTCYEKVAQDVTCDASLASPVQLLT